MLQATNFYCTDESFQGLRPHWLSRIKAAPVGHSGGGSQSKTGESNADPDQHGGQTKPGYGRFRLAKSLADERLSCHNGTKKHDYCQALILKKHDKTRVVEFLSYVLERDRITQTELAEILGYKDRRYVHEILKYIKVGPKLIDKIRKSSYGAEYDAWMGVKQKAAMEGKTMDTKTYEKELALYKDLVGLYKEELETCRKELKALRNNFPFGEAETK